MNELNLALFLYEIQYLLYKNKVPQVSSNLVAYLNSFIILHHKEYPEDFALLYDQHTLERIIEMNHQPLPGNLIVYLLYKYEGYDNYIKLIELVGQEIDTKINNLAIKFILHINEALEAYNSEPINHIRILH